MRVVDFAAESACSLAASDLSAVFASGFDLAAAFVGVFAAVFLAAGFLAAVLFLAAGFSAGAAFEAVAFFAGVSSLAVAAFAELAAEFFSAGFFLSLRCTGPYTA
ncbi:MAG: hypothetical protein E6167_07075, partial [Varibaculum cambriense]|nr:hypothetical protein [Varibaculum cambriense]